MAFIVDLFKQPTIPYQVFEEEMLLKDVIPIYQDNIGIIGLGKYETDLNLFINIINKSINMHLIGTRDKVATDRLSKSFTLDFQSDFLTNLHRFTKTSEPHEAMEILLPFFQYVILMSCVSKHQLRIEPFVKPTIYKIPQGFISYAIYADEIRLNGFSKK